MFTCTFEQNVKFLVGKKIFVIICYYNQNVLTLLLFLIHWFVKCHKWNICFQFLLYSQSTRTLINFSFHCIFEYGVTDWDSIVLYRLCLHFLTRQNQVTICLNLEIKYLDWEQRKDTWISWFKIYQKLDNLWM